MPNVITAGNSSNGGTAISTDTSGTLNIVTGSGSGANAITIDASQAVTMPGNLTVTGSITGGSISVANSLKAWVNFNGTGTVAIRASFNVTSITDNGSGDYTVNFTTAMPDINYCVTGTGMRDSANLVIFNVLGSATYTNSYATTSVRMNTRDNVNSSVDAIAMNVAIFR
jgi:hypothetical protein